MSYLIEKLGNEKLYFNVYGPTECTCICSSYLIKQSDFLDKKNIYAPLGKIADIFNYKIVDYKNKKVLDNKIGELVLSGPNVGYGYKNEKERTKKSFIFDNKKSNMRTYKTGDLVKYDKKKISFILLEEKTVKLSTWGIGWN